MTFSGRFATLLLFLGDIVIFFSALWLTLFTRYGDLPSEELFNIHITAFLPLFALWLLVFFMAGLYGKRILFHKTKLFGAIFGVQLTNVLLAALYFFFVPGIGLQPKTNLFLYLVISLALVLVWRLYIFPRVTTPVSRERAVLVGKGPDIEALRSEVNGNPRYRLSFPLVASPESLRQDYQAFEKRLTKERISTFIIDTSDDELRPLLPKFYELAFAGSGYTVLDFHSAYEEVFDRVPLSVLEYDWFLKNIQTTPAVFYPVAKRAVDIVGGLLMGIVTVIATPCIAFLMLFEGRGPVFIAQERIGQYGRRIVCYKFRSMAKNRRASDTWIGEEENKVTKLGSFLRRTSLDEFPQFVNVLKGEMSLIGPRNDIEGLGRRLAEALPYYNVRYLVPPGITGWAQINQQYEQGNISPQSIEETKMRLAYDFYYIKNRSFALDVVIALKTVKRMLFRVSSW